MTQHEKALRGFMKRENLDQQQLADRLRCDRTQVNKWLNGRVPSVSRLRDISRKLSIPIQELL